MEMKEKTPLKSKVQPTDLDSPPVKKSRQQKNRRILDDSSDEENNGSTEKISSVKQNGHVEEKKGNTGEQKDASLSKNGEAEGNKEERKLIEVTSPHNEPTLVPKRKTGSRSFPSCLVPLFQSECWWTVFHVKVSFHSHANKTNFQKKGCTPGLALKRCSRQLRNRLFRLPAILVVSYGTRGGVVGLFPSFCKDNKTYRVKILKHFIQHPPTPLLGRQFYRPMIQ